MAEPMASAGGGKQPPAHERDDVSAGALGKVAIAVSAFLLAVFIGIVILFKVLDYVQPLLAERQLHPLAETREQGSGPLLQVDPPQQRFDIQATEEQVLTTYDWVDREQGLVRIPIDRAIAILAKQGQLPKIDTTATALQP